MIDLRVEQKKFFSYNFEIIVTNPDGLKNVLVQVVVFKGRIRETYVVLGYENIKCPGRITIFCFFPF